jgi:hypothetical protein
MDDEPVETIEHQTMSARSWEKTPDMFPALRTISAAMVFQCLPHPMAPAFPPEYLHVPIGKRSIKTDLALAEWNSAWEAGVARHEFMVRRLPKRLRRIGKYPTVDFRLIPDVEGASCYPKYAPLYHLLPAQTLKRFRLPPLTTGIWPTIGPWRDGLRGLREA